MPYQVSNSPIDSLKEWSLSTFKCTKQLINEKRGKCSMTNDVQLKEDIEQLRDNQKKLMSIHNTAQGMKNHYTQLVVHQKQMLEMMNELSQKFYTNLNDRASSIIDGKSNRQVVANFSNLGNNLCATTESTIKSNSNDFSPILDHIKSSTINLSEDFKKNAISLNLSIKNGQKLIAALNFFCSNLTTLIYKTIDDTLITIKRFESVRLEYDAERNSVSYSSPSSQSSTIFSSDKLQAARNRYEQLRDDVQIKLRFLEENITKVIHKQLLLFHSAFSAYSNGNTAVLDSTLRSFSIV